MHYLVGSNQNQTKKFQNKQTSLGTLSSTKASQKQLIHMILKVTSVSKLESPLYPEGRVTDFKTKRSQSKTAMLKTF